MAARLTGELKTWHKTTLDFVSDVTFRESASTFRDYRLDVTFTHKETGQQITVPGFFAADGNAANSNATSGNVWRVNFNAPLEGQWTYEASFRTGNAIAASTDPRAGKAVAYIDGESGSFSVAETDKTGDDFRAKGMILQDEGTNYLQFQGDGDYFVRGGPGVPENFLATSAFDNTPGTLDYSTHSGDFNNGDPTWDGGKGKNLLGAINYLAEQGQNAIYVMTLTAAGDGKDVWPWAATDLDNLAKDTAKLDPAITSVYDVSKLAQWEIVFDFMDDRGIYKNVLLQERENDQLLDGGTDIADTSLSAERMIYMREMVARFGANNGIQWNLGEENTNSPQEREDMAEWLKAVDPYDHLVVVHTWPSELAQVYDPLLGTEEFDGTSFQASSDDIRALTETYLQKSGKAGDPWVIAWDENSTRESMIEPYANNPDSNKEQGLREAFWGFLTAGGSGVNWYIRQSSGQSYDQTMDTFDAFESLWTWSAAATEFYNTYIPFWNMQKADALTSDGDDYVMADPGEYYVVYLPYGEAWDVRLDLRGQSGENFDIFWYDPRTGGNLIADGTVSGGSVVQVGGAPSSGSKDWVLLARNSDLPDRPEFGAAEPMPDGPPPPEPSDETTLIARDDSGAMDVSEGSVAINVLDNDEDPDGTAVWIDSFAQAGNGGVERAGGGRLTYTPEAGFTGTDIFTYTAIDENGDTAVASVTVTVTGDVATPDAGGGSTTGTTLIARDDSGAMDVSEGSVAINVLDNDEDPDGTAVWIDSFAQAGNGGVERAGGGRLTYTPEAGFTGTDIFTYTAIDENGDTAVASVTVTVTGDVATPDAGGGSTTGTTLIARDDSGAMDVSEGSVAINVLDNDEDPDGTAVWIDSFAQAGNGGVERAGGGRLTYTPEAGFTGTDIFTYTAIDENGDTAVASVTVTVTGDVATPDAGGGSTTGTTLIARDDSGAMDVSEGSVAINVLDNDEDPDGTAVWIDSFAQAGNGGVERAGGGRLTYTPEAGFTGTDIFTYTAIDENGDTAVASVTVTVTGDVATPDADGGSTTGTTLIARDDSGAMDVSEGSVAINVLDNDEDPDGTAVWIDSFAQAGNGGVERAGGGRLTYTPEAGFTGTDIFTYTAIDENGDTDVAKVTVKVTGEVATPDEGTAGAGASSLALNSGGGGVGAYAADLYASGGKLYDTNASIAGTQEDGVYRTERYGDFSYDVPVENGDYDVTLKFAEIHWDDPGRRSFDVRAEGALVIDDLDVFAKAGGKNIAYDVVVPVTVKDGRLDLDFISEVDNAKISGIVVTPTGGSGDVSAPDASEPPSEPSFDAPFSLSGSRLVLEDVFLFGFGTDGKPAEVVQSGSDIGIKDAGSATEIDYRSGSGSEMIGFDFQNPARGIALDLGGLYSVSGATEGAIFRTYDDGGDTLDEYLITKNSPVTLDFGADVRFASLESAPWIADGDLPSSEPDFMLEGFDLIV